MLTDKINYYKQTGKNLTTRPAMYKEKYPFLREVDSLALANVQLNLQKAYLNYFNDRRMGFPKFKSKEKEKNSYTTNNQKGTIQVLGQNIRLPIIGLVLGKIHRRTPKEWILKSATISKENGKYYCSVLYEYEKKESKKEIRLEDSVGIIIDREGHCITSEGNVFSLYQNREKEENKIKELEGLINKKSPGSNNRKRLEKELEVLRRKTYNQKQDYLHKKTAELSDQYSLICMLKPNKKNEKRRRTKNTQLETLYTSIDIDIERFIEMISYKQTDKGGYVLLIEDAKIINSYDLFDNIENNKTLAAIYLKEKGYLMYVAEQRYMKAAAGIQK